MTTIEQTGAEWLVIASVCSHGTHVAITVMDTRACDPHASAESDENEVAAYGADWRPLVPLVAVAKARSTGLPISAMYTAAYLPHADWPLTSQERAAAAQIEEEAYRILHSMPLPAGVRVSGRKDC